ncbi:hypothetical protein RAJCM14343_2867 [Rhodococcus aetherivorans]|uniref:Uncharacterized protein n=1 Tax=Rhodococcus aetherivorans TaxID=191292 RepID=A0ABQ0YM21_9NOCA|nr:hypothetical protein RAJCM14343_2867 [Rhodococcus aetherivorans]CCW09789.1 hypothetical protein EBESD8_3170 [Rhodococcus aetherivorans]
MRRSVDPSRRPGTDFRSPIAAEGVHRVRVSGLLSLTLPV